MTLQLVFGTVAATAAVVSLTIYAATWLNLSPHFPDGLFLLGTALAFMTGVYSSSVLKPHYQIDRVLHIPRLKPFFMPQEYNSIWAVFVFMIAAFLVGLFQLSRHADASSAILQVFSAVWFGFFYIDAMILLRAKFPTQGADVTCDA